MNQYGIFFLDIAKQLLATLVKHPDLIKFSYIPRDETCSFFVYKINLF